MKITNERNGELVLDYVQLDDLASKEVSHKKRALSGRAYVRYVGFDEEFSIKCRVDKTGYEKLKAFMGDLVEISEAENLEAGEYFIEKIKLDSFLIKNNYYHLEFTLKKYFIQK